MWTNRTLSTDHYTSEAVWENGEHTLGVVAELICCFMESFAPNNKHLLGASYWQKPKKSLILIFLQRCHSLHHLNHKEVIIGGLGDRKQTSVLSPTISWLLPSPQAFFASLPLSRKGSVETPAILLSILVICGLLFRMAAVCCRLLATTNEK